MSLAEDQLRRIDPFLRKQPWHFRGRNADGRKLCFCGCGRTVGKGRASSHSAECSDWWRSHSDFEWIKMQMEKRDKGVCAACGLDTHKLRARIHGIKLRFQQRWRHSHLTRWLLARGWEISGRKRWWDADHVVPVIEGGGGCTVDGYRTLCIPCHKRATAQLAARRAAKRKPADRQLTLC